AHERELPRFEVAQASVDQLARPARGARRGAALLEQHRPVSGGGRGLEDAGAVDASSDDDDVELLDRGGLGHECRALFSRCAASISPIAKVSTRSTPRAASDRATPGSATSFTARREPSAASGPPAGMPSTGQKTD